MSNQKIKHLCVASTAAVVTLGLLPTQSAWAISGNIKFETTKTIYDKGDLAEVEITIKTEDGANFLLQTNMELSSGLSLQAVTGDNIQYNRGKIVGTAPQPEFVITVTMKVKDASDQKITLTDTKMGAVDGTPNYTINKTEKTIDVQEAPVTTEPTEPEPTTPPTEPIQPSEPEQPTEPEAPTEPAYQSWKATVQVSDELNIRQGPGLNYKIVGKYTNGAKLLVTDEEKVGDITWLKVEKGWISKDYVVEGHIEEPEKTDEEIEKEQQEQVKNEANETENQNQANNEAAQKQDEEKKEQYEQQENAQNTTIPPFEEENTSDETIDTLLTPENTPELEEDAATSDMTTGVNPVIPIDGISYVKYQTKEMQQPFYLYQESYSLQFPEELQKTSVKIGGLDFLVSIPNDVSMIKSNVYVVYGNYDVNADPSLYYFDMSSNSFFPYEKIATKTVIVDKTVEYENKKFSKSHLLIGLFGTLGLYALGALTTAIKYRKKDKLAAEAPHNITVTKPKPMAEQIVKSPKEVMEMSDSELEELLKVYGASTEDVITKRQPQKPVAKTATPPVNAKSPEMKWDTLARLMTNPENIEEVEPPVNKKVDQKLQQDIQAIEKTKVEKTQQIEKAATEISLNIHQENPEDIAKEVDEKVTAPSLLLDTTEPLEMKDLPENSEIELGELNPAAVPDMDEIPDMYLKFEQAVTEDGLNDHHSPKEPTE